MKQLLQKLPYHLQTIEPDYHHQSNPSEERKSKDIEVETENGEDNSKGIKRQDSFSSTSSLQDIPLLLPQEAEGLDNSHGVPKSNGSDSITTKSVSFRHQKAKIESVVTDMQMKGFVDDLDSQIM